MYGLSRMIFPEGMDATAASVIQGGSSRPDAINVADAELPSCGAFHRAGSDLHLHGRAGQPSSYPATSPANIPQH